jgi:hypothetical protein
MVQARSSFVRGLAIVTSPFFQNWLKRESLAKRGKLSTKKIKKIF